MSGPVDYFGTPIRKGQRVLHVTRHGSHLLMDTKRVVRCSKGEVWVLSMQGCRPAKIEIHTRLVVHPDDAGTEGSE